MSQSHFRPAPALVEVLKKLGYEYRGLYDRADSIRKSSEGISDQFGALMDQHFAHPVLYLCRLIEEATGVPRHDLEYLAAFLNTPIGAGPEKARQPRSGPNLPDWVLPDDPIPDTPDRRWIFPKLAECDTNGQTADILRRFEQKCPGVLQRFGFKIPNAIVSPQAAVGDKPPADRPTTEEQTDPATRAIALLVSAHKKGQKPSKTEIADAVGCSVRTLDRDKQFKIAWKAMKAKG